MRAAIDQAVVDLERREDVRVCLAVESGIRAWGFASVDSDYDVRFISVHRPDWYLSVDQPPNPRMAPVAHGLPGGWQSRDGAAGTPGLVLFAALVRVPLLAHGTGNLREYLPGDVVWRKKYLYVLRPLLALRWIEQGRGAVPMEFSRLVDSTVAETNIRKAINDLVATKIAGSELDREPRIGVLSDLNESEMKRAGAKVAAAAPPDADSEDDLDSVFRQVLSASWERTA